MISGLTLRRWQEEALPPALAALHAGHRVVVSAVMGSGKSIFAAAVIHDLLATTPLSGDEVVVITTPTIALVDQLSATLRSLLTHEVGCYYTHGKAVRTPIICACNNSAVELAEVLAAAGRSVRLWVADEAHKTQATGMLTAAAALRPDCALAMTATPFRSEERERLQLWDEVVYRYTPSDGIRDGVIVPWRIVPWVGEADVELDSACLSMLASADGPGIVSARTIQDAEEFAALMTAEGIPAEAIHSRLSRGARASLLTALEGGELSALVHVSLLSEGVDLPWLRWLCLRRAVGARVRFVQEVGRVLRSWPGKDHADIFDPHDLFGHFELSYDEALGWPDPEETADSPEPEQWPDDVVVDNTVRYAVPVTPMNRWLRSIYLAAQADGLVRGATVSSRRWRIRPVSHPQRKFLGRLATAARHMHGEAAALQWVAEQGIVEHSGTCSDLINLLRGLSREAKRRPPGWQWRPEIDFPKPTRAQVYEVCQRIEHGDGRIYVAGTRKSMPDGRAVLAWVVVRGARVLITHWCEAQPHHRASDALARAVEAARNIDSDLPVVVPQSDYLPRWARSLASCPEATHPAASLVWKCASRGAKELFNAP